MERKRETETSMMGENHRSAASCTWTEPTTQAGTSDWDPLVCRPMLYPLSHTGEGSPGVSAIWNRDACLPPRPDPVPWSSCLQRLAPQTPPLTKNGSQPAGRQALDQSCQPTSPRFSLQGRRWSLSRLFSPPSS